MQSVPVLGNSVSHLFPFSLLYHHPGSSLCCPPNSHAVLHLCCNRDAGNVVYIHTNLKQNLTGEPLKHLSGICVALGVFVVSSRILRAGRLSLLMTHLCSLLGIWENSHGGRNTNQPQQQLSNLSSSCPDALQVLKA